MMKREQIKVLKARLGQTRYFSGYRCAERKIKRPKAVKAAEATIKRFEARLAQLGDNLDTLHRRLLDDATHAIYFKDEKEALKVVGVYLKFISDHAR